LNFSLKARPLSSEIVSARLEKYRRIHIDEVTIILREKEEDVG
jgi:hypothetical protein